ASGVEAREQRSAGGRGIGDEEPAVREAMEREGVERAGDARARTGDMIEEPPDLRRGEIRIDGEAGALPDRRLDPAGSELGARAFGATTLPADRGRERLAGPAVPDEHGLALVGEADARDIAGLSLRLFQSVRDHPLGRGDDRFGVELDPAGPRKRA